ncbi:hypothetical protein [Agromyces neolithicus]|uniref:DUF1700 domain-containing protein n=1 Tax=Agromyces neolithicus TaxID=269420 RepID=A0ABN2M838_9MICO
MDPNDIIESYVGDVVGRLPRRQRADVGFELRSLLREELAGRADEAGRPADELMVMELLAAFGRPQDVADRYRPTGFTVIRPADAPGFAWVALGGVALQWAITLPAAYADPAVAEWAASAGVAGAWWAPLPSWWLTFGLGAFWWPGFMISLTLIASLIRHRRGDTDPESKVAPRISPQVLDRDRVNRPGLVLALTFWALGASVLIALPWLPVLAPGLPQPLLDAFVFDPEFLQWRAPWVVVLWAVSFAVMFAVLIAGRYTRTTRLISVASDIAFLALLTWILAAGPIFTSPAADGVVRVCLLGIMLILVFDIVVHLRRLTPTRAPILGS